MPALCYTGACQMTARKPPGPKALCLWARDQPKWQQEIYSNIRARISSRFSADGGHENRNYDCATAVEVLWQTIVRTRTGGEHFVPFASLLIAGLYISRKRLGKAKYAANAPDVSARNGGISPIAGYNRMVSPHFDVSVTSRGKG